MSGDRTLSARPRPKSPETGPASRPANLQDAFNAVDQSGDGKIDRRELRRGLAALGARMDGIGRAAHGVDDRAGWSRGCAAFVDPVAVPAGIEPTTASPCLFRRC